MNELELCLEQLRLHPDSEAAWIKFYQLFEPRLAMFLVYLGANPNSVSDLSQQAMLKFFTASPWAKEWHSLPAPSVVSAWLRTTAKHLLADEARSSRKLPLTELLDDKVADKVSEWGGFEDQRVNALLNSLAPEEQRLVIYKLFGFSLKEIARLLGISEVAAGTRFHRIKAKLRGKESEM